MRKFLLFSLLAILPVVFLSCNKDEDETNSDIVGKWSFKTVTMSGLGAMQGAFEQMLGGQLEGLKGKWIEFKADGTYSAGDGSDVEETGKWSLSGNTLTQTYKEGDKEYTDEATISINGKELSIDVSEVFADELEGYSEYIDLSKVRMYFVFTK